MIDTNSHKVSDKAFRANSAIEDSGRPDLSAKCLDAQSDRVKKCHPPLEHRVHVAGTFRPFLLFLQAWPVGNVLVI